MTVSAQAPATAQVWDVRYIADSTGPFAAGPSATQVGITIYARVGILPNTTGSGTQNLGVARVGGTASRLTFSEESGAAQGSVRRGLTADIDGQMLTDLLGRPLDGFFGPFRGSFPPGAFGTYGNNDDPSNGIINNTSAGSSSISGLLGGRRELPPFGVVGAATPTTNDPAGLVGEPTTIFRAYYIPTLDSGNTRTVQLFATGFTARNCYSVALNNFFAAPSVPIPDQTITFLVPGPGVAGVACLGAVALSRRRRGGVD
jgi:hypothetical protein